MKSVNLEAYAPHSSFGAPDNLGTQVNDEVIVDVSGNVNMLGVRIIPPQGGQVQIEGTVDAEENWDNITFRGVSSDLYEDAIPSSSGGLYLGSTSVLEKVRFRVTQAGTRHGTIRGRASEFNAILESIEHKAPPHQFGFGQVHHDIQMESATTSTLWGPGDNRKFVVTGLSYSKDSTNNVTVFDETDEEGNRLFKSVSSASGGINNDIAFDPPYVANNTGNRLRVTNGGSQTVFIVAHGYEIIG